MDALLELDKELLLFLNGNHTPFWDMVMMFFTRKEFWIPLYVVIVYQIFKLFGRKGFVWLMALVVLIVLCDQISTLLFKDVFERLRPSQDPTLNGLVQTVGGYKGGKYGFVSSHATNAFGFALFSSLLFRNRLYTFFVFAWSVLVVYTRIYLGVHFPGDVMGGMVLGLLLGGGLYMVVKKFAKVWFPSIYGYITSKKALSYSSAWLIIGVGALEIVTVCLVLRKLIKYFPF